MSISLVLALEMTSGAYKLGNLINLVTLVLVNPLFSP